MRIHMGWASFIQPPGDRVTDSILCWDESGVNASWRGAESGNSHAMSNSRVKTRCWVLLFPHFHQMTCKHLHIFSNFQFSNCSLHDSWFCKFMTQLQMDALSEWGYVLCTIFKPRWIKKYTQNSPSFLQMPFGALNVEVCIVGKFFDQKHAGAPSLLTYDSSRWKY